MRKELPKSVRKHIRRQKAAIRGLADASVRAQRLAELRARYGGRK